MRISDWSSDVCSSDLQTRPRRNRRQRAEILFGVGGRPVNMHNLPPVILAAQEHGFGSDEIDRAVFVRAHRLALGRDRGQITFRSTGPMGDGLCGRSEEHTSELQSLMRISYAVFCLKKKKQNKT